MRMRVLSSILVLVFATACSSSSRNTGSLSNVPTNQPLYDTYNTSDPYSYYYGNTTTGGYSDYYGYSAAPSGQAWVILGQNGPGNWYWIGDATPAGYANSICSTNPYGINPYAPNASAVWLYDEASGRLVSFGCWLVKGVAQGNCDPDALIASLCRGY